MIKAKIKNDGDIKMTMSPKEAAALLSLLDVDSTHSGMHPASVYKAMYHSIQSLHINPESAIKLLINHGNSVHVDI